MTMFKRRFLLDPVRKRFKNETLLAGVYIIYAYMDCETNKVIQTCIHAMHINIDTYVCIHTHIYMYTYGYRCFHIHILTFITGPVTSQMKDV